MKLGALCVLGLLAGAGSAGAQTRAGSLANVLRSSLIQVDEDFSVTVDPALADALVDAIGQQVASYPIGTSSGGFTYSFDQALGIPRRSTRSFGPAFTERALTVGARNVSFGINVQHAQFDRFEGRDLTRLLVQDHIWFTGVVALKLRSDTTAFVAQVGVLSNLDIGIVIPVVRVDLDQTVIVTFKDPDDPFERQTPFRGSSSGMGDMVVKMKYNFLRRNSGGLAAAVDLRLPTGDADDLRGLGYTSLKMAAVGSAELGVVAPHVNVGLTAPLSSLRTNAAFPLTGKGIAPWDFNYSGGVDLIAGSRATVTADLVGRTRWNSAEFGDQFQPDRFATFFTVLDPGGHALTQVLGAVGVKLNVVGTLLLNVNALVQLNRSGLASRVATVVGFDYAF